MTFPVVVYMQKHKCVTFLLPSLTDVVPSASVKRTEAPLRALSFFYRLDENQWVSPLLLRSFLAKVNR